MIKTEPFHAGRYLTTPPAQAERLDNALASGDAAYVAHSLGVIARALGVTLGAEVEPAP